MSGVSHSAKGLGWAAFLSSALAWGQEPSGEANSSVREGGGFELHPQSSLATPATRVTLDEAVGRALTRNPTYRTALLDIRRAEAVVRETKAAWLPTLSGNASVTHLDGNRVNGGTVIEWQNELGANFTLTGPLVVARQWMNTEESRPSAVTNIEVIDAEEQARDTATQEEAAANTARQARLTLLTATGHFP